MPSSDRELQVYKMDGGVSPMFCVVLYRYLFNTSPVSVTGSPNKLSAHVNLMILTLLPQHIYFPLSLFCSMSSGLYTLQSSTLTKS